MRLTTDWLARFHAGARETLAECYEQNYEYIDHSVAALLSGFDRETVVQDVFLSMVESRSFRENFHGGSMRAWLCTIARRRAIDHARRLGRELPLDEDEGTRLAWNQGSRSTPEDDALRAESDALVRRFRAEVLRPDWEPVFDTRFIQRLSQRDAARELGVSRTTLAYREARIRQLLRSFAIRKGWR